MKVSLDAEALRQAVFVRNLSAIETKTAFITLFLAGIKFAVVVKFKESFLKSHQFKIVLTSISVPLHMPPLITVPSTVASKKPYSSGKKV